MNYYKIILFLFISYYGTDALSNIQKKVARLKRKYKVIYGEPPSSAPNDPMNFYAEHNLAFPGGNKTKLSAVSLMWLEYYYCIIKRSNTITKSNRLPSLDLMARAGSVARIPCNLCSQPGIRVAWMFAESLNQSVFRPLIIKNTWTEDSDLTMYKVEPGDAGVYRCVAGGEVGGLVLLEVFGGDDYDVVKPQTSYGPYAAHSVRMKGLEIFTMWSRWTRCSTCDRVGRRRREGMCYVRKFKNRKRVPRIFKHSTKFPAQDLRILDDFPEGIACRSLNLPASIRYTDAVKLRRDEIMLGLCKVPCMQQKSKDDWIEDLPRQPPWPASRLVIASEGTPIAITCPGTTLRDTPFSWRAGLKFVMPRELDQGSNGRVHLDARDRIVFTSVACEDQNLYSCWQDGNLAGRVKLAVRTSGKLKERVLGCMCIVVMVLAIRCLRKKYITD